MTKTEKLEMLRAIYDATPYSKNEQTQAKLLLNQLKGADAKIIMAVGFAVLDTLAKGLEYE